MTILSSSPSLCSLKIFRSSSRDSLIDAAFFGNRTKASQSFNLRLRMQVVSSISASLTCSSAGEDFPVDYEQWLPIHDSDSRRRAGVLLHPTSFRGPHGIGDLGEEAFRFIDWLHSTGCSVWQVLPLVPPDEGGSPYAGQDANCGNTLLISLDELVKDGLLMKDELPQPIDADCVNYQIADKLKTPLITKAAKRLIGGNGELKSKLQDFRTDPSISCWLEDAAYFAAIDNTLNAYSWFEWPEPLKNRHLSAMEAIYQSQKEFWQKVREYAQSKGVNIMGDMPIYVGYHSADVWANKKHFLLNRKGFPLLVSGVPPDLFSETGQLWGSPLYDWKAMETDHYSWWVNRLRRAQDLYDECRIDHFRGFAGFWAVSSEAKVATVGRWKVGPGKSLFDAISSGVGKIKIIAEDLGVITRDVVELRKSIGAPGMAVLQFAFGGGADNPHLPHNHEVNQVVYSGTHDNDTIRGWWDNLDQEEKSKAMKYLSIAEEDDISWALIQVAFSSIAQTAIIPMQDILGLGSCARMNTPATEVGNWGWRIPSSTSFDHLKTESVKLRDLLSLYGRL
ncbi:4-alpha-glucanotransferase DPE1, chloroplastic/amyloplastic isoform X2 [Eutrema salsugineum]|uniref:4-alpha-glucanotransferase DPE1, chloroplastic/amyloplastic isoform X2 n=1 Tax=Eutrema salsugineum TaxID=72664 RepID=UPI000CED4E9D|nr:4-alpha-glucanotransferase DPE1, chloroplastic/amyloplastic isoform X2 [Eutrema salsugineum]